MAVERLLITGTDEIFADPAFALLGMSVNYIERRGDTIIATVLAEEYPHVIEAFRQAHTGATFQRRKDKEEGSNPAEFWEIVIQGDVAPWKPQEGANHDRERGKGN